ncbi:hypothetical protein TSUD_247440 [Trifolium subterraneum]|uniref:C2H2-type domain-containing protein n=1 Tax=Trifolium subterraneum TaxID=3900 RepID=A0A2Z6P409_TRISU|nr:hypothetical protein TSUD_247440 [Trifolium subterraneum]
MEGFHSDQYWLWMKRRQVEAPIESWEEKAFAEDAARNILNGSIWPPRFYSCNFCKREFRSAQALGGHMNIHRRDRARLKQNLSPHNEIQKNDFMFSTNSSLVNAREESFKDCVETSLSLGSGLTSMFGQKSSTILLGSLGERQNQHHVSCEEKGMISCKRLKTNNISSLPSVFLKTCSNDHHKFMDFHPSEIVLGINHGMDDLDLELRLGKQHKVIK